MVLILFRDQAKFPRHPLSNRLPECGAGVLGSGYYVFPAQAASRCQKAQTRFAFAAAGEHDYRFSEENQT